MNYRRQSLNILFAASVITMLTACDALVDCADNDGPIFETSELPPAVLNQVYNSTITTSIQNEPFDDRFDYQFSLFAGSLPPGVTAAASGRKYVISGTPTELGNFAFNLNVTVDDGLSAEDSGLCYRTRDRDFVLIVEQEGA